MDLSQYALQTIDATELDAGVYLILCSPIQTFYIGSTAISFKRRWDRHTHLLRRGKHPNAYLQYAWRKHGKDTFTLLVAERCSSEDRLAAEMRWIANLAQGGVKLFNIRAAGDANKDIRSRVQTRVLSKEEIDAIVESWSIF